MLRLLSVVLCVAGCSITFAQSGGYGNEGGYGGGYSSQQVQNRAKEKHPDDEVVPRIYRVSDLVLPTRHYEYAGVQLPSPTASPAGMGGGMMGGMGGGMFSVSDHLGQDDGFGGGGFDHSHSNQVASNLLAFRMTMDDLILLLESAVAPDSWDGVGGPGNISVAAGMLVVLQNKRVHGQILGLLNELRKQGATVNPLTVRAWWVSSNEIASMMKNHRIVDRAKLSQAIKTNGAVGQISCFDGQTVHLVAGNIRSILTGLIPVVGQLEKPNETLIAKAVSPETELPKYVLAQHSGEQTEESALTATGSVGYQPVTETNIFGGQLQLTASLESNKTTAMLDVQSLVIAPKASEKKAAVDFHNVTKLDQVDMVIQQFATTVRVPINQPVLVGGSTLEPMQGDEKQRQLYLIMEVRPDQPAAEANKTR